MVKAEFGVKGNSTAKEVPVSSKPEPEKQKVLSPSEKVEPKKEPEPLEKFKAAMAAPEKPKPEPKPEVKPPAVQENKIVFIKCDSEKGKVVSSGLISDLTKGYDISHLRSGDYKNRCLGVGAIQFAKLSNGSTILYLKNQGPKLNSKLCTVFSTQYLDEIRDIQAYSDNCQSKFTYYGFEVPASKIREKIGGGKIYAVKTDAMIKINN